LVGIPFIPLFDLDSNDVDGFDSDAETVRTKVKIINDSKYATGKFFIFIFPLHGFNSTILLDWSGLLIWSIERL